MTTHSTLNLFKGAWGLGSKDLVNADPKHPRANRLIIAGAGGVLGSEVSRQLLASPQFTAVTLLVHQPFAASIRHLNTHTLTEGAIHQAPTLGADTAVVSFEPGRPFYEREKSLWTPTPTDLLPLGNWLRQCGVTVLVVLLPHQPNRLPAALQKGLATLDELGTLCKTRCMDMSHENGCTTRRILQPIPLGMGKKTNAVGRHYRGLRSCMGFCRGFLGLTQLGFTHLVIVRSAQKNTSHPIPSSFPARVAKWIFDALAYMIPSVEQPLRAQDLAQFVSTTLQHLPAHSHGVYVAGQALLHQAKTKGYQQVISTWLNPSPTASHSAS
jgi:hypothetical protein